MLIIEDIHWADDATLDLVKHLARRLDGMRLLLVTTYRDDALGPHSPLQRLLGELNGVAKMERLALERLTVDAVRSLADGKALDVEALHRQTSGNPFFVTEAIASRAPGIPATVRDAVLARAARLTAEGRALIEIGSTIGSRIAPGLLERVAGDAAASLPEALESGILQVVAGDILFRHELAREAILESIDPIRRRRLFRAVLAEAAKTAGADRSPLAQLAHYAECADDREAVLHYGLAAAEAAVHLQAHREAAAQYRRLLRFRDGEVSIAHAACLGKYAEQSALIDDLAAAAEAYRAEAALWAKLGDTRLQGKALAAMAWPLVRNGRNAEAEAECRKAVALLEGLTPTPELAAAYRIQAHLRMLDRDGAEAVRIGRQAIAIAAQFADNATLAGAEIVVGTALLVANDDAGRQALDRSLVLAAEHGFDDLTALALLNLGSSYGEQYRFAEAERELTKGIAFAKSRDLDHASAYMSAWLALVQMYTGRWTEAAELAGKVIALPGASAISRIMALTALGRVRVRRGDPGQRRARRGDVPGDADRHLAAPGAGACRPRGSRVAGRRCHAHASRGRGPAPRGGGAAPPLHMAEAAYWLKLCGIESESVDWTATPFALALRGDSPGAASAWHALGCPYEAARAQAEGSTEIDCPPWKPSTGSAPGRPRRCCGGGCGRAGLQHIPRGVRASTRTHPAGLTGARVAVLDCLVEGLSNHEIAAKLFIAEKTVDHHVSAILAKLGAGEPQGCGAHGPRHCAKWGTGPPKIGKASRCPGGALCDRVWLSRNSQHGGLHGTLSHRTHLPRRIGPGAQRTRVTGRQHGHRQQCRAGRDLIHSYVTPDKKQTFCIYDGPSPEAIRKVATKNGLPIDRITEVRVLDPYFHY